MQFQATFIFDDPLHIGQRGGNPPHRFLGNRNIETLNSFSNALVRQTALSDKNLEEIHRQTKKWSNLG